MITQAGPLPLHRAHGQRVVLRNTPPVSRRHRWGGAIVGAVLLVALLPGADGRAAASAPNAWSPTGSMTVARVGQTATLLPTGKVLVAGGGTASAELYDPSTGAWAVTGSMGITRTNHTATLLQDGTVLVAGGCCTSRDLGLASAEIYNPQTGTWAATGTMTSGRGGHTATLLSNGQVLVTGGGCQSSCNAGSFLNALQSAELYNPQTRTWTATGSMSFPRQYHTATLLKNGQVLVAGGFAQCDDDSCSDDASAELYNPTTGTWTTTGSLQTSREQHTATLLPDGTVLVAGGLHEIPQGGGTGTRLLASAELYDPTTGTWSSAPSMATVRVDHTATLLQNGQVLVAGGGTTTSELYQPQRGIWVDTNPTSTARRRATATLLPNGTVLVAGGIVQGQALASAELYTPGPGPLVSLSPANLAFPSQLVGSTNSQTVTVLNAGSADLEVSGVVVTGANSADFLPTTTCTAVPVAPGNTCAVVVAFAPTATGLRSASLAVTDNAPLSPHSVSLSGYGAGPNAWSPTGSLNVGRAGHMAVRLLDGRVLVAGGQPPQNPLLFLASAELYSPDSGTWTQTRSLHTGRDSATATLLQDGDVLVAGGDGPLYIPLASAELYHPATGTWTVTGSMHSPRYGHTATLLPSGKVLVAGGDGLTDAELYDPSTGTWALTGAMTAARSFATATLLSIGKVLVAGGDSTGTTAELYNPNTGTWKATGSLNIGRSSHTATLLPNGQVLVAAGYEGACCSIPGTSAELYNPATGTWTLTGSLNVGRAGHTATLLPNGQVLVAGGYQTPCCNSAEIYNPSTGTWTLTSPTIAPRVAHTATLLPNGSVLVAGGDTTTGTTAEVYTPSALAVSPASGTVGTAITLSGSGFDAGEPVQLYWDSTSTPLTNATTSVTGAFTASTTVPSSAAGAHTIIAVGGHSGATAQTTFQVTP